MQIVEAVDKEEEDEASTTTILKKLEEGFPFDCSPSSFRGPPNLLRGWVVIIIHQKPHTVYKLQKKTRTHTFPHFDPQFIIFLQFRLNFKQN